MIGLALDMNLSLPVYREVLGDHWHTGFYEPEGQVGEDDQLRMERMVAESAGVGPDSVVLDVGCGVGGPACQIARLTGARIRGLTPSPEQLEVARAAAEARGVAGRVRFDQGEAADLPYPDASFDAVLFFESPCHFRERDRFFAEALRVLRPGGRLAGEDWLASESCPPSLREMWGERLRAALALPELGTVSQYAAGMVAAGFEVELARDTRVEMDLLRGVMADARARAELMRERELARDPIRRHVLEAMVLLEAAVESGALTVGRFVARKPGYDGASAARSSTG